MLCGAPCLNEAVEEHVHRSQSEVQQVLAELTRWQETHPDEKLGRRTGVGAQDWLLRRLTRVIDAYLQCAVSDEDGAAL